MKRGPTQRPKEQLFYSCSEIGCPDPTEVHPTGGSLRVLKQFSWLKASSGKVALFRPTHQRVPQQNPLGQAASRELHRHVLLVKPSDNR